MPSEVTATIMIGPIADDSRHGRPTHGPAGTLFCPSHVLTLMEGSRATWIVQRCPEWCRPSPARRIQPASPEHLLAAAVLGYAALSVPEMLRGSQKLRDAVAAGDCGHVVRLERVDARLAAEVFTQSGRHMYGIATVLPGSTITGAELRAAAAAGIQIAVPGTAPAAQAFSLN
jgi:hypothetical protein